MSLLTLILAAIGAAFTALLAYAFWRDPEAGLRQTTHHAENLPQVMVNRYATMAILAFGAVLYGQPLVIAFLFATFSYMGFADAAIYRAAGKATTKHTLAGIMAALVVVVALLAYFTNGAA